MSAQMVLLPVFVLALLTLVLLMASRRETAAGGEARIRDIALDELPLLFYVLIAFALPLRHADLFIVLMSWVFVVTRLAHAGIFVASGDGGRRSMAWLAGVLVLFAMWIYFAFRILLLI